MLSDLANSLLSTGKLYSLLWRICLPSACLSPHGLIWQQPCSLIRSNRSIAKKCSRSNKTEEKSRRHSVTYEHNIHTFITKKREPFDWLLFHSSNCFNDSNLFVAHHLFFLTLQLLLGQLLFRWWLIVDLGHNLFLLRNDQFDVAWRWHVWVDTTMCTVCAATKAWSTVDLVCKHTKVKLKCGKKLCEWQKASSDRSNFNIHFARKQARKRRALTWMWSITRRSTSSPLYSAFDSAFFNNCNKNSADFFGQRPCVVPHCLAWAQRPTPPLNLRNGTHSFLSPTFFKNRWARRNGMCLMAWAASCVFCDRNGIKVVG